MEETLSEYKRQQEEILGKKIQKVCRDTLISWKKDCIESELDKEFSSQKQKDEFIVDFCKNNNISCTKFEKNNRVSLRIVFNFFTFAIDLFYGMHSVSGDFCLDFKDESLPRKYSYYLREVQKNFFFYGFGSFLISFIKNISTKEEVLYSAIQELLKKYDENYLNKTAKTKEIASKSMASLCNAALNKTGYTWELIISKGYIHRLKIQIEGNRYLTVQVKEKEFVKTLSQLISIISDLKEFEKSYNTKINVQQFVPYYRGQKLNKSVTVE